MRRGMRTRLLRCVLSLSMAMGALAASSQDSGAVLQDKTASAVMTVYDEHLARNPNDYNILFARAHQNFYNGDLTAAIADINQALLLTPMTDRDLRFDEYVLRARISDVRKDYTGELADLKLAQELQPKSLMCTDLIAKAHFKAGNLDAAEKAFKTLLRAQSMNYDAMYGIALVQQARGNAKAALDQVNKAVNMLKDEPQVYVNRADIHARQGNIGAAVADLVQGVDVGNGGNALEALLDLSDTHYDQVMRVLSDMSGSSADGGKYRFMRATVAMDHDRFAMALADLTPLKHDARYGTAAVYQNLARCYLELGRWDEALEHAGKAISMDATLPDAYLIEALAQFHADGGGHSDQAMASLNRCSAFAPRYVPMLMAKALIYLAMGKEKDALSYMNAAVAVDPADAEALISRGMLLKRMGNVKMAHRDFTAAASLSDDLYDLRGIAMNELGRGNEALAWVRQVTATSLPGGENYYYAAVLMTLRGDHFRANEYLQRALDLGYGSLYRLRYDDLSLIGIKALRGEQGFDLLIDKARRNFME